MGSIISFNSFIIDLKYQYLTEELWNYDSHQALEEELKIRGIINLLAGVAYIDEEDEYLSHDSYKFHLREGYSEVAHMVSVGKKFDRWYDLMWFQKKV